MVKWTDFHTNLRNVLISLFGGVELGLPIAVEAGLNQAFLNQSPRPIIFWHSVVNEAMNQEIVSDLIEVARRYHPQNSALILAEQNLLQQAIPVPEIPEGTWNGPTEQGTLEKLLDSSRPTLRPINFLQRGWNVSRSVVRVVLADKSKGTGFLTTNNLLITNNHVIATPEAAKGAVVEFNFEKTTQGNDAQTVSFKLAPDDGFATSIYGQGGDDWTAVRLENNQSLAQWGALPLLKTEPKVGDEVIIIQHPYGDQKQIALSHNTVVFTDGKRLQYLTDTAEGSSGSPVFNTEWQVVGLHHAGGWLHDPGTKQRVFRNEGIHINLLVDGLTKAGLI